MNNKTLHYNSLLSAIILYILTASASAMNIGYFENKVFDDEPEILFANNNFNPRTNDTQRLQNALNRASRERNGGVVRLRTSLNGNNKRFSLARIIVPSNIRLEVEPEVILEMRGVRESNNINKTFLFTIGRSNNINNLSPRAIENIEITSTHPHKRFTIDSKKNMPLIYGSQADGNGNSGNGNTFKTGVSRTRSIPIGVFYAKNFSISNLLIIDNHTESVGVQLYPDTDYKDGAYAIRHASHRALDIFLDKPPSDRTAKALPMNANNQFINSSGNVVPDARAIQRNPSWGRTPLKGTITNIRIKNAHSGYGAVQIYGGDWIKINNIQAINGIGVRLESGNGTPNDNINRAGPRLSSINNIDISDVKVINGFTGVWIKPHSKIMNNIRIHNINAIDSGTALLIAKATLCRQCRDLTRGRVNNITITGEITLRQTQYNHPIAEVGRLPTFFLTLADRQNIAANAGKSIRTIGEKDIPRNPSGSRWYLIEPVAPVLALSQLSATRIGNQSPTEGFFPVDYSQAIISNIGLTRTNTIMYREEMRKPNGTLATETIYE
ncbi:hypothetical protein [Marinagarivorans algicola]|uniref:hypothetical protein n=1 Tax=Marinagarivorans algicola TaxID=1513270 RepID=UPI0006B95A41|nr:hypothetical protein [Marinagarivorans algicola]